MPHEDNAKKTRVCTKGCNQLVKLGKDLSNIDIKKLAANDQGALFDMAICQSEKRVACSAMKKSYAEVGELTDCEVDKWIEPVVICEFHLALWDLGATCITHILEDYEFPQCPSAPPSTFALARKKCRVADGQADSPACARLALSF